MKRISNYVLLGIILMLWSCVEQQAHPDTNAIDSLSISKERVALINFRRNYIDSLNEIRDWKPLKDGLWIDLNGELGLKTMEGNEEGIDIEKYITELCCEGISLKATIDIASFEFMGSSFYKDRNHIYTHYLMANGGNFWIVRDADVATFEILGDCYAKDKNHIFGERAMVMDSVDYATFKTKPGLGCFAKDKYGYYFWNGKLDATEINDSEFKKKLIELDKL